MQTHAGNCAAVEERLGFIRNLVEATKYVDHAAAIAADLDGQEDGLEGTQQELEDVWSVLTGIYNEYHDDGDQMSDACDCGYFDGKENGG